MAKLHTMIFDNPEFQEGLNFTVRLGTKWHERLHEGDFFRIQEWAGIAQVKKIFTCKLENVPGVVLDKEHDSDCQTLLGLQNVLALAYPDFRRMDNEKQLDQFITCVGFLLYMPYIWPYVRL